MFIRSVYWCFSFDPSFDSALVYSNLLVLSLFFVPFVMTLHCFPSFSGLLRQLLLSSFPTLLWQLHTALSPCRVTGFPALPALRHPRPDVWLLCTTCGSMLACSAAISVPLSPAVLFSALHVLFCSCRGKKNIA
jgi:hypothetical protein